MEINKDITVSQTGSALLVAGLTKLDDLYVGLGLIGIGVALKVLVAVLSKEGIVVASPPQG